MDFLPDLYVTDTMVNAMFVLSAVGHKETVYDVLDLFCTQKVPNVWCAEWMEGFNSDGKRSKNKCVSVVHCEMLKEGFALQSQNTAGSAPQKTY